MADKYPISKVVSNIVTNIENYKNIVARQVNANIHGHSAGDILTALGEKAKHVQSWLASAEAVVAPVIAAVIPVAEVAVPVIEKAVPAVEAAVVAAGPLL